MNLNGSWTLQGLNAENQQITLQVQVPGCVHTDFIEAGIIKDIYYRDNSKAIQWIENNDYTYSRTFEVENLQENAWLEFDGLDTYCDLYLNDRYIGEAHNMHIPHAYPVDGILQQGENRLEVRFRSPIKEVEDMPNYNGAFTTERMNTRRMQCTYSWDWVDRFVTMGIYKDVRLVYRKPNEMDHVYVYTKNVNPYAAQLRLQMAFRDCIPETNTVHMEITDPNGRIVFSKDRIIIRETMEEWIDIRNPKLWYPNGYGDQPLYTLKLRTQYSEKTLRLGIREITILQLEDEESSPEQQLCREMQQRDYLKNVDHNTTTSGFTVLVNGIKIMCKGANWVPCEPFPSAETPDKIRKLLTLGRDGGVNMLRVWGGGIFEQDAFYDLCDELGILVTQDFLMACGTYPEKEEWFINELKQETKAAAIRLRNHACLAWWSGDNENAVHGSENRRDFDGYLAATYGIEPVLKLYDPQRYFLPSSPYGGDNYCSATKGTGHNTYFLGDIFAYLRDSDFSDYRDYFSGFITRFSAEQAAFGLPFVSCLENFMTEEDIYGEDTSISEFHMKNNPALGSITLFDYVNLMAQKIFGEYTDGRDRILKQQMLHCEWIRLTLEAHRRNKWFSSGIIYWMFNDCWPAANGWSIVDYYANPKPGYYAFKRAAKPVIASLEQSAEKLNVYICNDSLSQTTGTAKVYLYDFMNDSEIWSREITYTIEANATGCIAAIDISEYHNLLNSHSILLCDIDGDRAMLVDKRFKDLDLHYEPVEILESTDSYILVKAKEFQPYVMLDVPVTLEENCFVMKKNEICKINIIKE